MTDAELTALRTVASAAVDLCENGTWVSGSGRPHIWRCQPRWADALAVALIKAGYMMDAEARDEGTGIGFGPREPQTYQQRRRTVAETLWGMFEDDDYQDQWPDNDNLVKEYEDQAEIVLHAAGVTPDGNEAERLRAALTWIVGNVDPQTAPLVVGRAKAALL